MVAADEQPAAEVDRSAWLQGWQGRRLRSPDGDRGQVGEVARGHPVWYLAPDGVVQYIEKRSLYREDTP